jgi:hypothetical protein
VHMINRFGMQARRTNDFLAGQRARDLLNADGTTEEKEDTIGRGA